ncbi:MAG: ATP-binding protein [Anaerolineales bacterium]|jgi:two-component system phosphate regulon sensor histidine kinase PhoR
MIPIWWLLLLAVLLILVLWAWRLEGRKSMDLERRFRRQIQEIQDTSEDLTAEQAWLESALGASQECLLVVDAELQIGFANEEAQEQFGPLVGKPTLISYTRSLPLEQLVSDAMAMDKAQDVVRVISLHDKPHRAVVHVQTGKVAVSLTDISEVQRLSRARQDMVANLSHELRTPLTSLRLLAETLQSPAGQDPSVASGLLDKIKDEVDSLEQMAREMLDLSAIESGRQAVRLVETELQSVVDDAVGHISEQAARKGVVITIVLGKSDTILADTEQASRAVLNVLHNAVKFTPQGSTIELRSTGLRQTGTLDLTIADEGPGIPPYDLERIFERFYRGDRSRVAPGTGLGLAIARHIMRSHGGDIRAKNRPAPERGAIFTLTFQIP